MSIMSEGDELDLKGGQTNPVYVLNGRKPAPNGNGYGKVIIQSLIVLILVGLGGWNLVATVGVQVEMAKLNEKVENHEAWGSGKAKDLDNILNLHENRLDELETGEAVATSDRFRKSDAQRMEYNIKDWTRTNFVMK